MEYIPLTKQTTDLRPSLVVTLILILLDHAALEEVDAQSRSKSFMAAVTQDRRGLRTSQVYSRDSERRNSATDTSRFYYHPDDIGAHAFQYPLNIVLGGSFGALYDRTLDDFAFKQGLTSIGRSLADPIGTVNAYGAKKFFRYEFIPHIGKGYNWLPNWNWHLIGGGFRTRLLKEYYIDHEYEHPGLAAWMTAYCYHISNEVVEAEKYENGAGSEDALADLLFFDWIGKLLFDIDAVNRVATVQFHLSEWSYQTQWSPASNRLFNNGQLYWVRYHVVGPISLSILTGEQVNTYGVSYAIADNRHVSIGYGVKAKDLALTKEGDAIASGLSFNAGLYYSVNDNPVVVASYEGRGTADKNIVKKVNALKSKLIINLYPGSLLLAGLRPGFSFIWQNDAVYFGITFAVWPFPFISQGRH